MANKIPYDVYQSILERQEWGDPTVKNQYEWMIHALKKGDLEVEEEASGALETGANAFADEVTMGLTGLGEQEKFVAGAEKHPWAAGIGAAIPYALGGAGALKAFLKKSLGSQAKPTTKTLLQNEVAKANSTTE